jgi:hypothetical protein
MTSPRWDESDDTLLRELSQAVRNPEPAPPRMLQAAKAAFSWRSVDDELELMTLVCDSTTHDGALLRSPLTTTPRTLVFDTDTLSLEIE